MSENHPDVLFQYWDSLVELLRSDNSFSKLAAIHIIATLVPFDKQNRFEKVFDIYYALLDDRSVMVASHIAGSSGKIARSKPGLQSKITRHLLNIDNTHFMMERKDLIKAYAIEAFKEFFEESMDQSLILTFVKDQIASSSSKTGKLAKAFLAKWE
jgi:hypothetical protein